MKIYKHNFVIERNNEAVEALAESKGLAIICAGGTDLLLETHQSHWRLPNTHGNVTQIPEMQALEF
jgi:hypothetical protein